MKEHLRQLVGQGADDLMRGYLAREYLQARILECLQDHGIFLRWAFLGGTALRFLYGIPRFSEDLDFSLITPGEEAGFRPALTEVKRVLAREGYHPEIKVKDQKTVASALVIFPGLPYELGLSPHATKTLAVRVEVDTNPPAGAELVTTIVRRHVLLNLCHYDKASLLAGKLHAVLSRPWAKGRDLYDLAWYLAERSWPDPNLLLLNAALAQTGWTGPAMTEANWRQEVWLRVEALDWDKARDDVRPFLERERDLALVNAESIGQLLHGGNE
ncbi:MAG: nucleotidyl transferase AbiEii/AbiGii toxin family protein [Thermoleophilia bacterium]